MLNRGDNQSSMIVELYRNYSSRFKHRLCLRTMRLEVLEQRIRYLIVFFIGGLVLSGITAFPLLSELELAHQYVQQLTNNKEFVSWIEYVFTGVRETNSNYPFIAYGTDWLAFSHLVIAVVFIGPLRDPVKNIWVIEFGLIACVGIFPLALIAGEIRGIPMFWRMIDCSFGLFGAIILWRCYRMIKQLETKNETRLQ